MKLKVICVARKWEFSALWMGAHFSKWLCQCTFLRPCFARFRMSRYDFLRCRHSRRVFKPFRIPAVEAARGVHAAPREAPFEAAHTAVIVFIAFLSAVSGLLRWKPLLHNNAWKSFIMRKKWKVWRFLWYIFSARELKQVEIHLNNFQ